MDYKLIDMEQLKDDVIAENMYARELEYFHYAFDLANFEHTLSQPKAADNADFAMRKDLEDRIKQTKIAMIAVDAYYAALEAQITDVDRHATAVARAYDKRVAAAEAAQPKSLPDHG